MICKGTNIYNIVCLCCRIIEGQKKVIDTYFEGEEVIIVFKCLACQGFTKVNYKPYLHRPFNGSGFKVEEPEEIKHRTAEKAFYYGIFD